MSATAIHVALVNYGDKKLTKELEFSAERSDHGTEKKNENDKKRDSDD